MNAHPLAEPRVARAKGRVCGHIIMLRSRELRRSRGDCISGIRDTRCNLPQVARLRGNPTAWEDAALHALVVPDFGNLVM